MESDSLELFVSDSVGELTNVPSVNSAADDGALRQRWLVWYERAHEDIVSLHSHQASWDELVAVVRRNPAIPEPNHILDFIADLYAPTIALGIRRQADRRSDVENLRRLIDDIANHPETLTREWYVAKYSEEMQSVGHTTFDRFAGVGQDATSEAVIRKDCEELDLAVSTVRKYVNKVYAHAANDYAKAPSVRFSDLREGLAVLERLLIRYCLLVDGSGLTSATPTKQYNFTLPLIVPWAPNDRILRRLRASSQTSDAADAARQAMQSGATPTVEMVDGLLALVDQLRAELLDDDGDTT